jgi:hypothetical protein
VEAEADVCPRRRLTAAKRAPSQQSTRLKQPDPTSQRSRKPITRRKTFHFAKIARAKPQSDRLLDGADHDEESTTKD